MKTLVPVEQRRSKLIEWRGSDAKIWIYDVTFGRLAFRLSKGKCENVMYVVGISCERIAGPFSWKDCDIDFEEVRSADGSVIKISDRRIGMELLCSDVVLVSGPATDFDRSFGDFVVDG